MSPLFPILLFVFAALVQILLINRIYACEPDRVDARSEVAWVHDGDTVSLKGGTRVRMIGINTPEIGRDGDTDQPYAKQARRLLREMLAKFNNRVRLRYGKEREDHHGRVLAHVYLPNDRNLSAEMLRHGLAVAITIPPNDWNLRCYRTAEAQARERRLGIWTLTQLQRLDSRQLAGVERGFRIVEGLVESVSRSRFSTWLNLQGGLGVHIDHSDARHFKDMDFLSLESRRILARGWIHEGRRGQLRMRLRHSVDLSAVD